MTGRTLIVQNDHVTRLTVPAAQAGRRLGMEIVDLPFAGKHALPDIHDAPVIIGSLAFAEKLRERFPHSVYFDPDNFTASRWAAVFGERFVNYQGFVMRAHEFENCGLDAHHVRTLSGRKMIGRRRDLGGKGPIQSAVMTSEMMRDLEIDPQTVLWVSPVRDIEMEARVWICGYRPAVVCVYRKWGRPFLGFLGPWGEVEITHAVRRIAAMFLPAVNVVMDLAHVDGEWKLLEFNPIHSSGWYGADIETILKNLSVSVEDQACAASQRSVLSN